MPWSMLELNRSDDRLCNVAMEEGISWNQLRLRSRVDRLTSTERSGRVHSSLRLKSRVVIEAKVGEKGACVCVCMGIGICEM